jgi:hypothetical protein
MLAFRIARSPVQELHIETACFAIDTWGGDPQSGHYGAEVLTDLRSHHEPLYGSFSTLLQSDFDDALSSFQRGSIDLLHIDGYHTYEAVAHDFETWLPKMSDQGSEYAGNWSTRLRPNNARWRS